MPEHQRIGSEIKLRAINKRKKCAGASLVEALIAIAIFAAFTAGACNLLVVHRKTLDMARDRYTAINIAKDRLELLRTFDFVQIPTLSENAVRIDRAGIPSTAGNFRRTTAVSSLSTNLYSVSITVDIQNRKTLSFNDIEGESLFTFISDHHEQ